MVKLRKAPALTIATGIPCAYLQTIEDRLLVSSADGRLHMFEPASSSRKWQAAFPEMEDLISGPISLPGVIWLLSRRGTLASFDAETGALTSTRSLGATAVVGPVVLKDRFGILLSSKLVVMDAHGHDLFTQTLRTKPRGLMAAADAFLLWSDPLELNVLRASDGETLSSFTLPENTCCVAGLSSGGVAVGTSSGEVTVFAPTGERIFSAEVETGQAVNRILEVGEALLVSCSANSLVSLGTDHGQRLGCYTDAEPLRGWVVEPGHDILVANRASRVIELSAPSLIQLDEYAVTGHLTGAGARVGARTFFGSDDGQLYVFQTSR
jgi:outer membrane protein assembly factor BamB